MENLLKSYPALSCAKDDIQKALELIINTYESGGKLLVCGNGGSASDSEHIVGELMKGFILKREVTDERLDKQISKNLQGALPAISLPSQIGVLSAFINDVEPDMMYAQLVYGYATPDDLVVGLSTSGNSKNVVNAVKVAKAVGAKALCLTGEDGGQLADIADVTIKVPGKATYKVQEYHLPVYHYLCAGAEKHFFG